MRKLANYRLSRSKASARFLSSKQQSTQEKSCCCRCQTNKRSYGPKVWLLSSSGQVLLLLFAGIELMLLSSEQSSIIIVVGADQLRPQAAAVQQHQQQATSLGSQQNNAQQLRLSSAAAHRPPAQCIIPTEQKHSTNQAAPSNSSLSYSVNTYLNSLQIRLFKFNETQPSWNRLSLATSNNTVRLLTEDKFKLHESSPAAAAASQNADPLMAFESICAGWRNSLVPARARKQPAYWVLDRRRAALVAKFDYYDKKEFFDIQGHMATLTSPTFKAIPPYHFMRESPYFGSCKISLRTYKTLNAHLELIQVPKPAAVHRPTGAATARHGQTTRPLSSSLANNAVQQQHILLLLDKSDQSVAKDHGETAVWRDHLIMLPTDNNALRGPYGLEFAATPSVIKQDSLQKYDYLNGIAIANFTLTPQCFGLDVDEKEWTRLRQADIPIEQYQQDLSNVIYLSEQKITQLSKEQDDNELSFYSRLIEEHKTSILIGVILVLVSVLVASQWLLCVQLHCNNKWNSRDAQRRGPKSRTPPKSSFGWFCWKLARYLAPLCPCCWCSGRNDQIYATTTTAQDQSNNGGQQQLNGKLAASNTLEQYRAQNNYLRPISATIFENVELNVNPTYLTNESEKRQLNTNQLAVRLPAKNPLEPYYIDRKRLTLTKPLGKGAFGEVYQGYLVCRCSNDGKTLLAGQQQDEDDDSLESHSLKVAVKTLTDERMSEIDFMREAINMSLVSHRNIVELLGVCFDEKPLYIVMELMPGGNLKNFLLKNRDKQHTTTTTASKCSDSAGVTNFDMNGVVQEQNERIRLNMGDLLVYALDIARACDYLQKRQFIHRDLAARNCLLSSSTRASDQTTTATHYIQTQTIFPNSHHNQSTVSSLAPLIPNEQQPARQLRTFVNSLPSARDVKAQHRVDLEQVYLNGFANSGIVAKLADFGMTRDIYSNDYYRMGHKELPVRWMPPECLDGVATSKSDVWSFGVFLWELFSMGQLPYQQLLDNHQVIQFIKVRRHARATIPTSTSVTSQKNSTSEMDLMDSDQHQQQPVKVAVVDNEQQAPLLIEQQKPDEEPSEQIECPPLPPPLPPPHDNTPHPIYAIMCACWAASPDERPQFEEIANRLYWCLQMPDVLATSLPCFYEQHTPRSGNSRAPNVQMLHESDKRQNDASQATSNAQQQQQDYEQFSLNSQAKSEWWLHVDQASL